MSAPGALAPIVDQVIAANAAKADEYRAGKTGLLGFFVGQVMRQSGGNANPALVSLLVQERLEGAAGCAGEGGSRAAARARPSRLHRRLRQSPPYRWGKSSR